MAAKITTLAAEAEAEATAYDGGEGGRCTGGSCTGGGEVGRKPQPVHSRLSKNVNMGQRRQGSTLHNTNKYMYYINTV